MRSEGGHVVDMLSHYPAPLLSLTTVALVGCHATTHPDTRYARTTASILATPLDRLEIKEGTLIDCLDEFSAAVHRATAGTGRLGYVFIPPRLPADDKEIRAVEISESNTTLHRVLLLLAYRWGYRVILSDPMIPASQTTFQRVGEVFFIKTDRME